MWGEAGLVWLFVGLATFHPVSRKTTFMTSAQAHPEIPSAHRPPIASRIPAERASKTNMICLALYVVVPCGIVMRPILPECTVI